MQKKEYYTMLDMAKELGVTKQAIHIHAGLGHLPAPAFTMSQTQCWRRKDAEAFMRAYKVGNYPKGRPVKGSKMPRKEKDEA